MGVAIGSVVHGQVAALVGTLVWLFLVETLLVGLFSLVDVDALEENLPVHALEPPTGRAATTCSLRARARRHHRLDRRARRRRPRPNHADETSPERRPVQALVRVPVVLRRGDEPRHDQAAALEALDRAREVDVAM